MGNWYANIQKGQDDQQARYNAIADRERQKVLDAQADADRLTENARKAAEAAYLKTARENMLKNQEAAIKAAEEALKKKQANEAIARDLASPESPITQTEAGGTTTPYVGAGDFDVGVGLGDEFMSAEAIKDERARLEALKTSKFAVPLEQLEADLIAANKELMDAKPAKRDSLNKEIKALEAQIKKAREEKVSSVFVSGSPGFDEEDTQWNTYWHTADAQTDLYQRLSSVNISMIDPPWKLEWFMRKKELDAENLEDELQKWIGGGTYASNSNQWFIGKDPAELAKFEADPIGYYSRNKQAIEKASGVELDIPGSGEVATAIADDPGALAEKEARINELSESLGVLVTERDALTEAIDNPDLYNVFDDPKWKDGQKAIMDKYYDDLDELQEAIDTRDEELIKRAKAQALNNPVHKLLSNQAFGADVNNIIDERASMVKQFEGYRESGQLELALVAQHSIREIDKRLWSKIVDKGILDLQSTGNGQLLEAAMSEHMGHNVNFQRRTDGKYHFFVDGELYQNPKTKKEYWTEAEIASKVSYEVNEQFEAAQKAHLAAIAQAEVDGMLTDEKRAELFNTAAIEAFKGHVEIAKKQMEERGAKFSSIDSDTGNMIMNMGEDFWMIRTRPGIIEGTKDQLEATVEKLDIPSMLNMVLGNSAEADASMMAWLKSLGIPGFNNAGLTLP